MDFERSVYCLSHYMNTDKLICNCFIFMELDIVVDFIIHTFWFWWVLLSSFCERIGQNPNPKVYDCIFMFKEHPAKNIAFDVRVRGSKVWNWVTLLFT